jgi:hypothetical protein
MVKHGIEATAQLGRSPTVSGNAGRKTLTAAAQVDVRRTSTQGTIEITSNGLYNVSTFAEANVSVPIPSNYGLITWNGQVLTVS